MVACFIALIVFSILGIFSAKYRKLAKEAFKCVFLKITLRPCEVGLDKKIKAGVLTPIVDKSPNLAKFLNNNFEAISFVFTIIMIASLLLTLQGIYNWAVYGNCEGPLSGGVCIYNQLLGIHEKPISPQTEIGIVFGPQDAKIKIIQFGCFTCPYTKKAEPIIIGLLDKYPNKIRYVFKTLPIQAHSNANETAVGAYCAQEQGKFWEYRKLMFDKQEEIQKDKEKISEYAKQAGLNVEIFKECIESGIHREKIEKIKQEANYSKIRGTPTFFVNDEFVETEKLESKVNELMR